MRELINKEDNIYCLNGDIIEIDSVKFGGCDGWYNDGYLQVNNPDEFFPKYSTNIMWQNHLPDYKNILEIENFDDFYEMEKPKIEKVYKDCDVMITHINPSVKDENMNSKYKNNLSNTFFCFDGEEYLKNGSMKYWIFGHNHDVIEYKEHNVKCICNPLGYFNESGNGSWVKIKQIEV